MAVHCTVCRTTEGEDCLKRPSFIKEKQKQGEVRNVLKKQKELDKAISVNFDAIAKIVLEMNTLLMRK